MASGSQLVVALSLLQGKGWLGGSPRLQARHYAMLLVEQGVLWVLPMLWLVLLLSEEAGAATATTGSRLLGAPEGHGQGWRSGPQPGFPISSEASLGVPQGGVDRNGTEAWDTHESESGCTRVQL